MTNWNWKRITRLFQGKEDGTGDHWWKTDSLLKQAAIYRFSWKHLPNTDFSCKDILNWDLLPKVRVIIDADAHIRICEIQTWAFERGPAIARLSARFRERTVRMLRKTSLRKPVRANNKRTLALKLPPEPTYRKAGTQDLFCFQKWLREAKPLQFRLNLSNQETATIF